MKRITFILLLTFLINSCSKNPEYFIEHLSGYWEIESVTLANGTKKDYTINETIDFIEVNDSLKGFRKKLKPRFDGKYETSADTKTFKLKIENDSLNVYYATKYTNWKETVLNANTYKLKIANQNSDVYIYKRFTPISIN